jgi:hypothetical protein
MTVQGLILGEMTLFGNSQGERCRVIVVVRQLLMDDLLIARDAMAEDSSAPLHRGHYVGSLRNRLSLPED